MTTIPIGRYRHYKGREYSVLDVARHSETTEEVVVYRQEYGDRSLWVRPKQMFLETVEVAGRTIPRFQYLGLDRPVAESAAGNLLDNLPDNLPEEYCQTILRGDNFRVERIVSRGHTSPDGFWYDQSRHEFVVLLLGSARLRFEDRAEPVALTAGDFLQISAHRRHRIEWTDPANPTLWLAIHYQTCDTNKNGH